MLKMKYKDSRQLQNGLCSLWTSCTISKRNKNEATPHKLEDLIPSKLIFLNHDKEKFLQAVFSNKHTKKQRFMIFTTEYNLEQMCKALFWVMDGTFDVSPDLFYQLYIIHAPVENASNSKIFPLVYILVNKKSENLYTRVFQILSDLILKQYKLTISTKFIITDFEKAVINSTRTVFNLKNKAWFFRFS